MPQCGLSDGGSIAPHLRDAGGSASIGETLSGIARLRDLPDLDAAVLPTGGRAPHVRHEVDLVDRVDLGRGQLVDTLAAPELARPPALVQRRRAAPRALGQVRPALDGA